MAFQKTDFSICRKLGYYGKSAKVKSLGKSVLLHCTVWVVEVNNAESHLDNEDKKKYLKAAVLPVHNLRQGCFRENSL